MGGCMSKPEADDDWSSPKKGAGSGKEPKTYSAVEGTIISAAEGQANHSPSQSQAQSQSQSQPKSQSQPGEGPGPSQAAAKPRPPPGGAGYLPGSAPGSPEAGNDEPMDLSEITGRSIEGTSSKGERTVKAESADVATPLKARAQSLGTLGGLPAAGLATMPPAGMNRPASADDLDQMNQLSKYMAPMTQLSQADRAGVMFARMAGSVHGGIGMGARHPAGGAGVPGGEEDTGGSMHGSFAAMGSASMQGGMATGSLHGGGMARPSSVALRALQAAKLRATKPALERHNVQIEGHGSELLVFSHAFGYNRNVWSPMLESLDHNKYRIVLYDLTGALGTDYDAFDFQRYSTLHGFAEDLLLLLSELGVEGTEWGQQCTFIGHQHSGMMGLLASIERPKVFKRIIMIASTPRLLDAPGYEGSFALADLDQVFGIMQANFKTWSKGYAPVLNAEDIKAAHVRELTRPLFLLRPDIAFSNLKTAFACDVRDVLPKVEVQVHMLFLAKDQTVPQSVVQFMLNTIPNAYAEILPVESFHARPELVAAGILRHANMPLRDLREVSFRRFGSMRFAPPPQQQQTQQEQDDARGRFDVDGGGSTAWKQEDMEVEII